MNILLHQKYKIYDFVCVIFLDSPSFRKLLNFSVNNRAFTHIHTNIINQNTDFAGKAGANFIYTYKYTVNRRALKKVTYMINKSNERDEIPINEHFFVYQKSKTPKNRFLKQVGLLPFTLFGTTQLLFAQTETSKYVFSRTTVRMWMRIIIETPELWNDKNKKKM